MLLYKINHNVQTVRDEGNRPFHVVQKCLILGNTGALAEELAACVDGINPHLFRFITHLILFLKSLGLPMKVSLKFCVLSFKCLWHLFNVVLVSNFVLWLICNGMDIL